MRIEVTVTQTFTDARGLAAFAHELHLLAEKFDLQPEPIKLAGSSDRQVGKSPALAAPFNAGKVAHTNDAYAVIEPPVSAPATEAPAAVSTTDEKDSDAPGPNGSVAAGAHAEAPKKRGRRTNAEIAAAEAAKAQSPELPKASTGGAAGVSTVPTGKVVTFDDVQKMFAKMNSVLGSAGRNACAELCLHFNLPRLREIKEPQWCEAIAFMERKIANHTPTAKKIDDEIPY